MISEDLKEDYQERKWSIFLVVAFVIVMAAMTFASLQSCYAGERKERRGTVGDRSCTNVARSAYKAAYHEIRDDYWVMHGKCVNLADVSLSKECMAEAMDEYRLNKWQIQEQHNARRDICSYLGEEPYDPVINPADFVDFEAVINGEVSLSPQSYLPLIPGTTRIYIVTDQSGKEVEQIKVEVLPRTKEIQGVNCIVIRDRVWEFDEEGELLLIEDTDDWYAQDILGNVWYFGEIAQNYEDGELVDLEGSWTAGKEYDMPGVIMLNDPQPGEMYRQEFSLANAEDMAQIDSFVDSLTVRGTTYFDVLKTIDFTPLDPGIHEYKFYAPGVGLIKEEKAESGEVVELIQVMIQ